MDAWIAEGIQPVTDEMFSYLRRRGFDSALVADLGLGVWLPPSTPSPDSGFNKRYGSRGQALEGHLAIPLRSSLGDVVGLDTREVKTKRITGYRLPKAKWVPVWIQTPNASKCLWNGGRAWLVEGLFDLAALQRNLPIGDAIFATQRAALTYNQAIHLARVGKGGVIIAYDNDEAGKRGTMGWTDTETGKRYRGAKELLSQLGVSEIQICRYLGKDPGDVWLRHGDIGLKNNFGRY